MKSRDPKVTPLVGDIVRSTVYKNGRERHVTRVGQLWVYYEAVTAGATYTRHCSFEAWRRWCKFGTEVVQLGDAE